MFSGRDHSVSFFSRLYKAPPCQKGRPLQLPIHIRPHRSHRHYATPRLSHLEPHLPRSSAPAIAMALACAEYIDNWAHILAGCIQLHRLHQHVGMGRQLRRCCPCLERDQSVQNIHHLLIPQVADSSRSSLTRSLFVLYRKCVGLPALPHLSGPSSPLRLDAVD